MNPSSPRHGRAVPHHPRVLRRSALVLAAFVAISGTPLVARAIGSEPVEDVAADLVSSPDWPQAPRPAPVIPDLGADLATGATVMPDEADPDPAPVPEPVAASPIEVAIAVLTDTYAWDEQGPRVEALQGVLDVTVDGWYGLATLSAHRRALEDAGLPIDLLPVPPGPSADQWAALRQCESGGDYSITNPSGKYRGAYQFDRRTWNAVAERHAPRLVGVDPAAASPAEQDAMALALYGERGPRPWPNCGRHLR